MHLSLMIFVVSSVDQLVNPFVWPSSYCESIKFHGGTNFSYFFI